MIPRRRCSHDGACHGFGAPRRGRILLILGIVLLGISLRYAVTGLSPLLPVVREGLGIGVTGASIIGMLPTLMFGAGGLLAPILARPTSTELVAVVGMTLATIGAVARAMATDATLFIVLSAVSLLGMGFGNVAGAPLVKKYFPDRQAIMLTTFALLMQAGATLPAFTAVPISNAAGWRWSLASWALISFLAIIPWAIQLFRKDSASAAAQGESAAAQETKGASFGIASLLRSPTAVGTALFYATASFNTYAVLAWMPTILGDRGLDLGAAAGVFSIYTFMTLPMALIVPLIAAKMEQPFPLAAALSVVHAIGFTGLLLAPGIPALWVTIMGLGGGAFPFAIAMFNRRTRTEGGFRRDLRFRHGRRLSRRYPRSVGRWLAVLRHRRVGGGDDPLRRFRSADARRCLPHDQEEVPGGRGPGSSRHRLGRKPAGH